MCVAQIFVQNLLILNTKSCLGYFLHKKNNYMRIMF